MTITMIIVNILAFLMIAGCLFQVHEYLGFAYVIVEATKMFNTQMIADMRSKMYEEIAKNLGKGDE